MKAAIYISMISFLAATSEAKSFFKWSIGSRASCPVVSSKSSFDINSYIGDWYQVQGIPSFFQPAETNCVRATYTVRSDTSINVRNIGFFKEDQNKFQEICGYAENKDASHPAELKLNFPGTPEGDYWVIDTDYENWSAVYSCGDIFGLVKFEYAFLLTRTPQPSEEAVSAALKAYTDQGISLDAFIQVPQPEDCVYANPDGTSEC